MACSPVPSHFIWEMGHRATWGGSSEGEGVVLGARGSKPLMVAGGPEGSQNPSSPTRRHAWSGWHAWWKVERELDSLSMPS
jgi:hypothetical protein